MFFCAAKAKRRTTSKGMACIARQARASGGRSASIVFASVLRCVSMRQLTRWALDFVRDAIAASRTIRVLSVIDAYTRECLALEVDSSFASRRLTPCAAADHRRTGRIEGDSL